MATELAWGRFRRLYLRTFRKGYLARMRACRKGDDVNYPQEILDPRDLKFFCNQGDIHWDEADDPFAWRGRLRLARVGFAEILIIGGGMLLLSAFLLWLYWPLAPIPLVLALFVVSFFRDPRRHIPTEPGSVVSPADGEVFSVREVEYDNQLGGPAVVIDIFLSVLNVHLNRVPIACRILEISYQKGKFLNALRPEAARENESLTVRLEGTTPPFRVMCVRQIAGAIARRIVCWAKPGDTLPKGGQFGMIKLGSRTELTLPREPGLEVRIKKGDKVRAGSTIMACYAHEKLEDEAARGEADS
jgi:phosphatidylserine decarboxylase